MLQMPRSLRIFSQAPLMAARRWVAISISSLGMPAAMWVLFADDLGKQPPELPVVDAGVDAQNDIGVVLAGHEMAGADAAETLAKSKNVRDIPQIGELGLTDRAVGLGNMEQAVQYV